jgi:hypothetical protein
LVECSFDVFDGGTLVLGNLNRGIKLANVGIGSLDVLLVLDVVRKQGIELLGMVHFHLGRGKNGQVGPH